KDIKEGRLSATLRGVFPAGSYVHVMQSKEASEIFGAPENLVDEGAAVAIPIEAVKEVCSRFSNTLYGYFIGNRLAFLLVENYVKNTWAKFGLKRIQLHEDFFMFQFNTKDGMKSVMESGPWLIWGVPLILNVWNQNTDLEKDIIKVAPLWVKLHHVPIVAYSEVGLGLITTQLGKPIMLDSYTSNMCVSSWGRNTYAQALIEFSAKEDLKDSIVIAIPLRNGKGHSLAKIEIEYEWTPPRCVSCKVFDHTNEKCPKNPKKDVPIPETDDGFTMVKRKNTKPKQNQKKKQIEVVRLTKLALNLQYRKVDKGETSKKNDKEVNRNDGTAKQSAPKVTNVNSVPTTNSFGALSGDELEMMGTTIINEDSNCEALDEELIIDDPSWNMRGLNFSPKQNEVRQVISENNLSICAILESHVANSNLHKMCSLVFRHWDWSSNRAWCDKGTRIILGWNHNECLLGDFNATFFLDESTASSSRTNIAMREFKACVDDIEVIDVNCSGLRFTWIQKPRGADGILKKLDRIIANMEFFSDFVGAIFKPYQISDHAPSILCIPTKGKEKPKPFKFYNILSKHERFLDVVQEAWNKQYSGFFMFQIGAGSGSMSS
nr:hypothetical protein [Tanacetum cinerariifolium]